jgi:hypothetical protein
MSKHKRTIFFDSLHDKSKVFSITEDNRKEILEELLGRKYNLIYDKKGKLTLDFKNY